MECVKCKEQIDNDSRFCDQCGVEIKICSVCGEPGKGKRCTQCGKEMIAVGQTLESATNVNTINVQTPTVTSSVQNDAGMVGDRTVRPESSPQTSVVGRLFLVNNAVGLQIEGYNGAVLGRRNGPYTNELGQYGQISGTHARLDYDAQKGWFVTDLGSTNGTKVDRSKIGANAPVKLSDKGYLQIANIEFYVEIK